MPATKANGTLMARRGLGHDHCLMFSQVELGGLEPPAPCLQTGGSTSTGVHRRRSPSWDVHLGPVRSRPVAVLSGCTHRQVPQQPGTLRHRAPRHQVAP
jgi:hypothetical protein